jgi:hypothetical protein
VEHSAKQEMRTKPTASGANQLPMCIYQTARRWVSADISGRTSQ